MLCRGWCRGSVRLYSDFYESDIIVASPLALATKLTEDEEEGEPADVHFVHAMLTWTVHVSIA
jgi:hypothetical protein